MANKSLLSFIAAALLAGAGGSCAYEDTKYDKPLRSLERDGSSRQQSDNLRTTKLKLADYVSNSWYGSDHSFWSSNAEQLAGSEKSRGIVDLFAEIKKYPFNEINGWREWQSEDATYRYKLDGQRHNFTIEARNGSFDARYQLGIDESDNPWVVMGEVFKKDKDKKIGWAYSIKPGDLSKKTGSWIIPVHASTLDGNIGDNPLWRPRNRKNDYDFYTASPRAIYELKNKGMNKLFR